jgi:predicted membrane protein
MFLGIIFLVIGLLLVLQHIFHIDLPIIKILFGVFLIYLGIKVIFGSFGIQLNGISVKKVTTDTELVFSDGSFRLHSSGSQKINTKFESAFSKTELDLSQLSDEELSYQFNIDQAFGRIKIKTRAGLPIKANINGAFGKVTIRGQKLGSFGEISYQSENYNNNGPALQLSIGSAFSEVVIE